MKLQEFNTKEELYNYLIQNKELLIEEKKSAMKKADAFQLPCFRVKSDDKVVKMDEAQMEDDIKELMVRAIISTAYVFDSHQDVHIPGMWNKTLQEKGKNVRHLKEHTWRFENVIADKGDVTPSAKRYTWRELNVDADGETEALTFDSLVKKDRNEYMFNQYLKGYVDEHSVGMKYVKLALAVNEPAYEEEYRIWLAHIDKIVNREQAEATGYFWAIYEAKLIEGSAVVAGSNPITPTHSVEEVKQEPEFIKELNQTLTDFKTFISENFKPSNTQVAEPVHEKDTHKKFIDELNSI